MNQDVYIDVGGVRVRVDGSGVSVQVQQRELRELDQEERLAGPVLVQRVERELEGGGFGDPERHPHAWGVFVVVDGAPARLYSARNKPREWTSLDRLEPWLREQGFRRWQVVNGLDPVADPPPRR